MGRYAIGRHGRAELGPLLDRMEAGVLARSAASWALAAADMAGLGGEIEVWCVRRGRALEAICLSDAFMLTIVQLGRGAGATAAEPPIEPLAEIMSGADGRRHQSILGPPAVVGAVSEAFSLALPDPGQAGERYLFMVARGRPAAGPRPDPTVRPAGGRDLGLALAASARSAAEAGLIADGPMLALARHHAVTESVASGRYLIKLDQGEVVFKAQVAAVQPDLEVVHSVWMSLRLRGQGRSASAMAAVLALARGSARTVALFVSERNEPALRCYHHVGFESAGTLLHARLPADRAASSRSLAASSLTGDDYLRVVPGGVL